MATVSLHSLNKSFGQAEVLKDISLDIQDGEFVVFVGPSGCGKSTLLRIIAGLEEETSGQLVIDGQDVAGMEPIERGIAMVFQSYALYPHMTVYNNIAFPLKLKKLPKAEVRAQVEKAAAVLDLTDRLDYKPGALSGGQRQRVAIGRAIVRDPKVFLFDEPLSNLDASLRGAMRVELSELHQKLKTTMIYVTHDQVEAMTMADRIVVLKDGRLEQFGTPMALYHMPKTRFVAGFIGQPGMNFIAAKVQKGTDQALQVIIGDGTPIFASVDGSSVAVGDNVEVGVRPDDFELSADDDGLKVTIRVVERLGASTIVYGNLGDGTSICAALDGMVKLAPAETVRLKALPELLHVFRADGNALTRLSAPEL